MIEKLIKKYEAKLKYITDLKNKTSFELVRVSCLEKEFIVKEILQDLEELKQNINKLTENKYDLCIDVINGEIIGGTDE